MKSFADVPGSDLQQNFYCNTILSHDAPINSLHVDINFFHLLAVSTGGCFWRIAIN